MNPARGALSVAAFVVVLDGRALLDNIGLGGIDRAELGSVVVDGVVNRLALLERVCFGGVVRAVAQVALGQRLAGL